jgi:hypothetical protein
MRETAQLFRVRAEHGCGAAFGTARGPKVACSRGAPRGACRSSSGTWSLVVIARLQPASIWI